MTAEPRGRELEQQGSPRRPLFEPFGDGASPRSTSALLQEMTRARQLAEPPDSAQPSSTGTDTALPAGTSEQTATSAGPGSADKDTAAAETTAGALEHADTAAESEQQNGELRLHVKVASAAGSGIDREGPGQEVILCVSLSCSL